MANKDTMKQPSVNREAYVAQLKAKLPDRESVYKWLYEKQPSVEELTQIKTSLNSLFPGSELLPDEQLQRIYGIVDGELLQKGL